MEVMFHEFGHHLEGKIPTKVKERLTDWYETLYKDKFASFNEFFADFVSDAFIRKSHEYALAAKANGLETET